MADKLWNKLTTAASGHKKRLISCPWVCCWCAAWAQHSSRLKCENNVGRCAFDLTEWHLPRYPWDWVVKHCKDLLLPHLRCKENNSLKLNICLVTLCRGWSRRMEVCNMFFSARLGSARLSHLSVIYWTSIVWQSSVSSRSNHRLPPISLVCSNLPPSLPLPLSLINTYCRLCLP